MSAYYFAKYDRGNVTSGTIACGERKRARRSILQFISAPFFSFRVRSLEPYEIQFAPRHSSVSFLDPRYASAFHWHASCHLLLRRATLSASMRDSARLGAMRRGGCTTEQRRDATRHEASCHTAARLHGMRTDGILDAMRGPSLFSSGTGIRVEFYHPRPQTSPGRERSRSSREYEYARARRS